MNPIATGVAGALISGVAMYTVGTASAQAEPSTQNAALVQTVDGQFAPANATTLRPVAAPSTVRATPVSNSRRASAPARRAPQRVVTSDEREYAREDEEVRSERTWGKTAMVIGGSAASGAGVGGIVGGKKGALIGAAIGGGAASIYEATRRR
jgi:hypothetical protein